MGATERRVQPTSQATPLAGDVLGLLRGAIGQGGFQALTPLQQQSQMSLSNFIPLLESGQQTEALLRQLEQLQGRQLGTNVAQQRESLGAQGLAAGGSSRAAGEASLRSQSALGFEALAGNIMREQTNIQNQQLLQAIGLGGQLSQQNIAPFLQMASLGILPEQVFFEQNPFVTGLQGLAGLGAGAGGFLTGIGPLGAGVLGGGAQVNKQLPGGG